VDSRDVNSRICGDPGEERNYVSGGDDDLDSMKRI
jgi:hypothetical protein